VVAGIPARFGLLQYLRLFLIRKAVPPGNFRQGPAAADTNILFIQAAVSDTGITGFAPGAKIGCQRSFHTHLTCVVQKPYIA